jgi:hypothetical protein
LEAVRKHKPQSVETWVGYLQRTDLVHYCCNFLLDIGLKSKEISNVNIGKGIEMVDR